MELLLDVHEAAADRLATRYDRIALVGKSMGGRIGSHLVGDRWWPARAVAYLGYPLVPPGKAEPRATDHLHRIGVPQLFIAGTRDRLSPPDAIRAVAASLPDAAVSIVDDADHSLRVPKRTGLRDSEVLRGVVGLLAAWLERADQRRGGV